MGVMTFTRFNNNKVVIYAGNYHDNRSDDLYVFDLDTKVHNTIHACINFKLVTESQ